MLAKLLKKIGVIVAIISVGLLIGTLLFQKHCTRPISNKDTVEAWKAVEKVYRPPLVKIPFVPTKNKQPVKDEHLPIPKKQVAKTISIDLTDIPPGESPKFDLIVDKKGNIWVSKDTPEKAKVVATKWKPKFFGLECRLGYSLAYNADFYHCLSLDFLRIGSRFHIGGDAGVHIEESRFDDILLGVSVKYDFSKVEIMNLDLIRIRVLFGYDFLSQKSYVGIGIRW